MSDCPFCAAIESGTVVYEDEKLVVVVPEKVVSKGHFQVIPKEHKTIIKVERDGLHAALKKAAITAGNEVRSVQMSFKPGKLHLYSQQEGIGESESEIPIEYDGDKFEITFNPDFIMDYLKVIDSTTIPLCFKDEHSSCMIEDNERDFYIVMPITTK